MQECINVFMTDVCCKMLVKEHYSFFQMSRFDLNVHALSQKKKNALKRTSKNNYMAITYKYFKMVASQNEWHLYSNSFC